MFGGIVNFSAWADSTFDGTPLWKKSVNLVLTKKKDSIAAVLKFNSVYGSKNKAKKARMTSNTPP